MRINIVLKKYLNKKNYYFFYKIVKRIKAFKVLEEGTSENLEYVKYNNKIFYSYPTSKKQKIISYIFGINKHIKCFNPILDISLRYLPPPRSFYPIDSGKYYDFKKGDIVFEVGAYIGFYAMKASELVSNNGKIFAIEAIPENFNILAKNIYENNIKNIIPINKAISNNNNKDTIYRSEGQRASFDKSIINTKEKVKILSTRIDDILTDYNLSKVDFVRIQINGGELNALEGSKNLLNHYRPKLLIAVLYGNRTRVYNLLKNHNYNVKIYNNSFYAEPLKK